MNAGSSKGKNVDMFTKLAKYYFNVIAIITWDKVFKNGPSTICGRQASKYMIWSA